jgi:hypothetical protein
MSFAAVFIRDQDAVAAKRHEHNVRPERP